MGKDGSTAKTIDTLRNITGEDPNSKMVKLILDCEAGKVSLHFTSMLPRPEFHIDVPKGRMWRLNVTLRITNSRICILD